MDEADEADRAYQRVAEAVRKIPVADGGPEPILVTYCLHCGKPMERVFIRQIKEGQIIRRFCCVQCRDEWDKERK